jgi:hypothetical protein
MIDSNNSQQLMEIGQEDIKKFLNKELVWSEWHMIRGHPEFTNNPLVSSPKINKVPHLLPSHTIKSFPTNL